MTRSGSPRNVASTVLSQPTASANTKASTDHLMAADHSTSLRHGLRGISVASMFQLMKTIVLALLLGTAACTDSSSSPPPAQDPGPQQVTVRALYERYTSAG